MAELIALSHASGVRLDVSPLGITWASCRVQMATREWREVILGGAAVDEPSAQQAYMGTVVGRYANRIANAQIERGAVSYALTPQPGSPHQLHGGPQGLHLRTWGVVEQSSSHCTFHLVSPHGDQGFPGELSVRVRIDLCAEREIAVTYTATTTQATPVCLTHHPYFNLNAQHDNCLSHRLRIDADAYLPVTPDLIPTGELRAVADTAFNFRASLAIEQHHHSNELKSSCGHDHAYLLNSPKPAMPSASLHSSSGDLRLDLHTTLPALQLYTGHHLGGVRSRSNAVYARHAGVALEPQFLPDSPNHPEWPQPDVWLQAGAVYHHSTRYCFSPA